MKNTRGEGEGGRQPPSQTAYKHLSIWDLDRRGKIVSQRRTQIMSPAYRNSEINKSFEKSESFIMTMMRL